MKSKSPEQILHTLNSHRHESDIVESSSRHAERKDGEKNGNAEQKIGAYLRRLDTIAENSKTRERLVHHVTNELLVQYEDIPEAYWKQQEQLARDNGQDHTIDDSNKKWMVKQLQDAQRTGINSWLDYLEQTNDQYPTWFKVYAVEGMTNLATFNKKKGIFNKRSKGTVAPYPQLNPAALAKVYDAVKTVHQDGEELDDAVVEAKTKGGNFNKLYSHFLLETKSVIATPERPEDVYGEWTHYTSDDVEAITEAAQGTPWCIAGEEMARRYTERGGSFYLFHLEDLQTGEVSPTAAASVRMGDDDKVAEISGLLPDQRLEDALVPTVMEKVKSLPGGDRYIAAFEDRQKLIAMDRKFQADPREPFTIDELRFLYEIDRDVNRLNGHSDSRLEDFKADLEVHERQLAEVYGEDKAELMVLDLEDYFDVYGVLVAVGGVIGRRRLKEKLENALKNSGISSSDLSRYSYTLARVGVSKDKLDTSMIARGVIYNNHTKEEIGKELEVLEWSTDDLISSLSEDHLLEGAIPVLLKNTDISADTIQSKLSPVAKLLNRKNLHKWGIEVDVNDVYHNLAPMQIVWHADELRAAGVEFDVREAGKSITSGDLVYISKKDVDYLISCGVSADAVAGRLSASDLWSVHRDLMAAGATLDGEWLAESVPAGEFEREWRYLQGLGASIDMLVSRMNEEYVRDNIDELFKLGVSDETLVAIGFADWEVELLRMLNRQ